MIQASVNRTLFPSFKKACNVVPAWHSCRCQQPHNNCRVSGIHTSGQPAVAPVRYILCR